MRTTVMSFALVVLAAACQPTKDAQKCQEALNNVTRAVQAKQFDGAMQWRDYAYKQCADQTALQAMDKSITDKKAEIAKAEAEEARAKPLMDVFSKFVAQYKSSAERSATSPLCPEKDQPDAGWCTGTRGVGGGTPIEIRYQKETPGTFQYTVKGSGSGTCKQLGGQEGRSWSVTQKLGGVAKRTHCKLSGLDSVVSVANGETTITLASPGFIALDPNLKRQIESEGK